MTTSYSTPSAQFPAIPSVRLQVPDTGEPLTVEETILAVGAPTGPGEFKPNVCVTTRRKPRSVSIEAVAAGNAEKLSQADGFVEIGRENRTVLGVPGLRMEGSFEMAGVGGVFQAVHLAVIEHATVTDIVEVVASSSAEQARTLVPVLRGILDSAELLDA